MRIELAPVDPKKALRIAWIVESIWYFALASTVLIWKPERIEGLVKISPYLFGLIAGQGAAGWSGSSIKRLTEAAKERGGGGNA